MSLADYTIYTNAFKTLSILSLISPGDNSAFAHFLAAAVASHNNLVQTIFISLAKDIHVQYE